MGAVESEFPPKTILSNEERTDLIYAVKIAINNDLSSVFYLMSLHGFMDIREPKQYP